MASSEKTGFDNTAMSDYPNVEGGGVMQSPPPYSGAAQYGAPYSTPSSQYPQYGGQYPQTDGKYPPYSQAGTQYSGTAYPPQGAYYSQPVTQSSNVVVTTMPGVMMAQPFVRENTPPPDTTCGLVVSILVLIFCAWPCGIGAIIANRRAKGLVDMGQHTQARANLKQMYIWIAGSIVCGIILWVVIGIRIKLILDSQTTTTYYYG